MEARFENDRDERYTRRLEAFSDIVIGFSLAQLSLNFVIPPRWAAVYSNPVAPVAFAITLVALGIFWFMHHRLFESYFVPRRTTVILNFVTLGLVLWLIYQLQLFARFEAQADGPRAAAACLLNYAAVYASTCALYVLCLRLRWPRLGSGLRVEGVALATRAAAVSIGTLAGLAACLALGWHPVWGLIGVPAVAGTWTLAGGRLVERIAAA